MKTLLQVSISSTAGFFNPPGRKSLIILMGYEGPFLERSEHNHQNLDRADGSLLYHLQ